MKDHNEAVVCNIASSVRLISNPKMSVFSSRKRCPLSSTLFPYTTLFRSHKAASDVRDEFVSVTEKLMDELAQCYNVLPQLDINNTIDHRPEGDEKWFLENEKTVTQFCRKLAAERPLKDIRDEYNYPK